MLTAERADLSRYTFSVVAFNARILPNSIRVYLTLRGEKKKADEPIAQLAISPLSDF